MTVDISKLEKLASGFTSDVFILDETRVVKVFFESMDYSLIENEYNVNKLIQAYGISVPKVYEMAECGNRKGIIFQRIRNYSLKDEIDSNPKRYLECAAILASEHTKVNAISDYQRGLVNQKKVYTKFINSRTSIDEKCKKNLIEKLNSFPESDKVCHGDFHPINLLFNNNDVFIIDWLGATRGDPLADAAGSYLIIKAMGTETKKLTFFKKMVLSTFISKFADAYIKEYLNISGASMSDIEKWLPIRAATYLDVGLPQEANKRLLKIIHKTTK